MPLTPPSSPPEQQPKEPLSERVVALRVRRSAIVGGVAGFAFALFNLLTPGQALLGQIELASVVLVILPSIYLSFQEGKRKLAETLLLIGALLVFSALIVLGGIEGTGLLWAFIIPFLAFFLKGPRLGSAISLGFVLACGLYFFAGVQNALGAYRYTPIVEIQFLLALVFYSVVAALFNVTQFKQDLGLQQANLAAQRANQELAASRAQFQFIADNAPVFIAQYDQNQRYRFTNQAVVNLFGRALTDVQGKPIRDVVGESVYREISPYLARALQGEVVEYEASIPAKDGPRAMLIRYQPEWDASGKVVGLVAAAVDMTLRRQAESALAAARQRLQLAMRVGDMGVWEYPIGSLHVLWDPGMFKLYGVPSAPEGLVPVGFWERCVHPDDMAQVMAKHIAVLEGRLEQGNHQYRIIRQSDGAVRHMRAAQLLLRDAQAKPTMVIGTDLDITDLMVANEALQQAAKQLAESNRNISRILATASHDLRQPAHALGLLLSGLTPTAPADALAQTIARAQASAQALQNMLDAYFDYSWSLARSRQAQVEPVSMTTLFDELDVWFKEKAREENIRLLFRPKDLWVASDGLLLRRILLNLLSNALRYCPGGTVLVCCRRSARPGELRIEVRDNGVGIDPLEHDQIFQEFYQSAKAGVRREDGLGLGLSMVRQICDQLGIALSFQSAPQRGTSFTLRLPLADRPSARTHTHENAAMVHANSAQTVLLIEDEPNTSVAMARQLERWGYQVTPCASVEQALGQLDPLSPPDLLLTDHELGTGTRGLDGVSLIREKLGVEIPACLITANSDPTLAQQARAQGLGFITKPFAPSKLRSWLQRQQTSALAAK